MFKRLATISVRHLAPIAKVPNLISNYITQRNIRNAFVKCQAIHKKQFMTEEQKKKKIEHIKQNALTSFSEIMYICLMAEIKLQLNRGYIGGYVYYCCDADGAYMFPKQEVITTHIKPGHLSTEIHKIKDYNGHIQLDMHKLDHVAIINNLQNELNKHKLQVIISCGDAREPMKFYRFRVVEFNGVKIIENKL